MRLVPHREHPLRQALRHPRRTIARLFSRPTRPGRPATVVYVSGEPSTPGHVYRVARHAQAARELGYAVDVVPAADVGAWRRTHPVTPGVVIVWRTRLTAALGEALEAWRAAGARIIFDVDDYMFDPGLARVDVIDGIRSQNVAPRDVAELYAGIRRTLAIADEALAPTERLCAGMAAAGVPARLAVNGFDADTYRTSRAAVLQRRQAGADGIVRIGYASGTLTHQRDFAVAAPAVARVLREHPRCRLVLFRDEARGRDCLDVGEFPELAGLADRIEWRPLVPLERLPAELARFDVNLAPLEVGNVYCEAKSELKYFEAALVDVPTIASPTQPFREAILHGRTGLLAEDEAEWHAHLDALVGDAEQRARLGRAALLHVLHRYGPDGRRERLAELLGTPRPAAADGTVLRLHDGDVRLPDVPDAEVLWHRPATRVADVAVVVPLYNYARYVVEALDSVAAQTLVELELIVVDDCSTDDGPDIVAEWLGRHGARFVSATLLRNRGNQGLSLTRNVGFARADAPLILPLDADNTLEPRCLERLAAALTMRASAAHPTLRRFGNASEVHAAQPWSVERFRRHNYIDAMALIRKSAWAHVGGYVKGDFVGWEDYDMWCRFVEAGFWSAAVPGAVAGYRVHGASMLHTQTHPSLVRVVEAIRSAHPWLSLDAA